MMSWAESQHCVCFKKCQNSLVGVCPWQQELSGHCGGSRAQRGRFLERFLGEASFALYKHKIPVERSPGQGIVVFDLWIQLHLCNGRIEQGYVATVRA